jgi:predicted secreted protein
LLNLLVSNPISNSNQIEIIQAMENQAVEIKRMRPSETIRVVMISRGALGLQLLWRMDTDSVVEVKRVEPNIDKSAAILPGDPIEAVFEVKSIQKGTVKITFYETQSWNKEFKDIIQKEIIVEVND